MEVPNFLVDSLDVKPNFPLLGELFKTDGAFISKTKELMENNQWFGKLTLGNPLALYFFFASASV